jgi:hypothetical protein
LGRPRRVSTADETSVVTCDQPREVTNVAVTRAETLPRRLRSRSVLAVAILPAPPGGPLTYKGGEMLPQRTEIVAEPGRHLDR